MKKKIIIKIGRKIYDITDEDIFMDNNFCIQLLSQNKGKFFELRKTKPKLSKRAEKQINKYDRIPRYNTYGQDIEIFSLKI